MANEPPKTIALFFTYGMSVKGWYTAGLVKRDTLLYERLSKHGYQTHFITYGDENDGDYLPDGSLIRVHGKPWNMGNLRYGLSIPSLHRDVLKGVDIIKSHQVIGSRFAVRAKSKFNKTYVARGGYLPSAFLAGQNAGPIVRGVNYLEERLSFRSADIFCVPSQTEIDYLSRRYRVETGKGRVCPNWIDTDVFKPDPSVEKKPRRICFVGRFEAQKQPFLLLDALRGLEDVELLMIGGGPLRKEIDTRIREYGIAATVLDRVDNEDLPHHLNSSALYVLPTLYEGGSPKTLLEAMACGLPVICTKAFGADEAFDDGIHGLKVEARDVDGLRHAMAMLLEAPERGKKLGEKGRQRIIDFNSIEKALEREIGLIEELARP